MPLKDADGPNRLMIRVTGYQFPDAMNLARRFSWHMVGGEAHCQEGSWRFQWQALTCEESPPFPLDVGRTRLLVSFDLEFQPPWHRRRGAGDPFALSFTIKEEKLRQASEQWDAERPPFPDRTG